MRNFWLAFLAAVSALSGVRKRERAAHPDLRPHHYVVAGICCVLLFVVFLVTVVNLIV